MPPQPAAPKRCKALTTSGKPCARAAVPGLTVCSSHGGGTAASVKAGRTRTVAATVQGLWGHSVDAGSTISVEAELTKLIAMKTRDVTALRIKISSDPVHRHIGKLVDSETQHEYDIEGTVQSKTGTQTSQTKRGMTSIWVQELHRTEAELVVMLKLLQEVSGGQEEVDVKRIRMQTAREAARLLKAFPGISVDEVAAEVSKRAS